LVLLAEMIADVVTTSRLRFEGRLMSRAEEIVHQEAGLKEQWDDGLLIICRTDSKPSLARDLDYTDLNLAWRQK